MKVRQILIIEDEPLLCNAYELIFNQITETSNKLRFHIKTAYTVEDAKKSINNAVQTKKVYDIVILDLRLTNKPHGKELYGEKLGLQIRKNMENTKIVVVSSTSSNYVLHNILKKINPEGFMIKAEMDYNKFKKDIVLILQDQNCYTETVIRYFKNEMRRKHLFDAMDREILYKLSLGLKLKELPKYIPLSLSGIERRKRRIAEVFNLESGSIKPILKKAKENGLL